MPKDDYQIMPISEARCVVNELAQELREARKELDTNYDMEHGITPSTPEEREVLIKQQRQEASGALEARLLGLVMNRFLVTPD